MSRQRNDNPTSTMPNACSDEPAAAGRDSSRRDFLKSGAGLAAGAAAAPMLGASALAQGGADAELARVLAGRRVLLKGGVVLSLDRQVGDFARADVLIEDGKIREVRPDIAAADAVVVDATNHIVVPGFIDTHHHFYQGILRNILSNGLLNPDYQRDIAGTLTAAYQPAVYAGELVRRWHDRPRHTTAVDTRRSSTRLSTPTPASARRNPGRAWSTPTHAAQVLPRSIRRTMRLARTTFS